MTYKDHVFFHIAGLDTNLPKTLCINMLTGAVTFMTNLTFTASGAVPATDDTDPGHWFLVQNHTTSKINICDTNSLFDGEGADAIRCASQTQGPAFKIVGKAYGAPDGLSEAWFKAIGFQYQAEQAITVEVARGLDLEETRSDWIAPQLNPKSLAASTSVTHKRVKPDTRSDYLQFQLYISPSAPADYVKIGAITVFLEPMWRERY